MGFVHYNNEGWLVDSSGKPMYVVGINYVASYVCTNFFQDWRPEIIEADLKHISELGFNAVRMPIFWGFTEPEIGVYNPVTYERFDTFLQWAEKYNLYVMPWFLVGVATVDKDFPHRNGRNFFDLQMTAIAENHLRTFAKRYKNNERILCWDICDEPEAYSFYYNSEQWPYETARFKHWLQHMYDALKKDDPNHLVTLGFGGIASMNYGYTVRDAAEILDVMVATCYPGDSAEGIDTLRNNYYLGFYVKFNTRNGKPVFACEAPGFNNIAYSKDMVGRYFNVSIWSNLVNGSTGVLPWVYNDFAEDIWTGREMNDKSLEPYFGIIENDQTLKPNGQALKAFGEFVRDVGITEYRFEKPRVAIMIPNGYYNDLKSAKPKIRSAMQYAKGCGADIAFVWEGDDISQYDVLIVVANSGTPFGNGTFSATMLNTTHKQIREYVQAGGTLIHGYDSLKGLSPYSNGLFGVEVQTRHKDFGFDSMTVERPFAGWSKGEKVSLSTEGRVEYLKVKATTGEVVATFADGSPAIVRNQFGKGTAWLMTGQFHSGTFDMPYDDYLAHPFFRVYDAIFDACKLYRPARYVQSAVETGLLHKTNGDKLLICVNHDHRDLTAKLTLDASLATSTLKDYRTGKPYIPANGVIEVSLTAAGTAVIVIKK